MPGVKITIETDKARLRERLKTPPDPHFMPDEARQPSDQMIDAFHDVMDECANDGCDVDENSAANTDGCEIPGCDVEQKGRKKPSSLASAPEFSRLPLIYQLTVADAVLNRGGRGRGRWKPAK